MLFSTDSCCCSYLIKVLYCELCILDFCKSGGGSLVFLFCMFLIKKKEILISFLWEENVNSLDNLPLRYSMLRLY